MTSVRGTALIEVEDVYRVVPSSLQNDGQRWRQVLVDQKPHAVAGGHHLEDARHRHASAMNDGTPPIALVINRDKA
jgi:hypothetical protein